MRRLLRLNWVVSLSLLSSALLGAQTTASLATEQTRLTFAAGAGAPRLISIQGPKSQVWANTAPESLVDHAEVDGTSVPLHWQLDQALSHVDPHGVRYVYQCASPKLRLTWEWLARAGTGPVEHTIDIQNLDSRQVWLPLQDSFRFNFTVSRDTPLKQLYVDKGAGKPTEIGTHESDVSQGYKWEGLSSPYAQSAEEREIIPWFMVQRSNPMEDGWYVGVEFTGRTHLSVSRQGSSVNGAVGLNPNPGPFRTRLLPKQTFATPTVFVGAFRGGADGLGNVLRPWVRQVLNNPVTWSNPNYPTLVNNSWGSLLDINEALILSMLRDASSLGLEMLHIDAGWFRAVGDWYPDPVKFPHGVAVIADEAHQRGMKFGIWVNWTQAGVDTEPGSLNMFDPKVKDWLVEDVRPNWKPGKITGMTIDIGEPAAKQYADREVQRLVHDYHLDLLEHDGYLVTKNCSRSDHPHAPPPAMSTVKDNPKGNGMNNGMYMPDTVNSTDVSYHAARAYYDVYAHLRQQNPGLLLEACNDGGRMVDFGTAAHADYFSITDSFDPTSNREAFYDASHVLPAAMLEDYVEKWPTPRLENFLYMLRSGMMGWMTVMLDTNAWTEQQHVAAREQFALYKSRLRPLIRDADLYHLTRRPDGVRWDGIEYFDPRRELGAVYAFRGTVPNQAQHTFPIYGLNPAHTYHLHFQDQTSPDRSVSGQELLTQGLTVTLPLPQSSELVFLDDTPR